MVIQKLCKTALVSAVIIPLWGCGSTVSPESPVVTTTETPTAIVTVTATPSMTPTAIATSAATPSMTPTAIATATATPSMTPTAIATAAATPSMTPTVIATAAATPSMTPTAIVTAAATPSMTPTAIVTATATPSMTPTVTATATATPSMTPTAIVTATATPSMTPTATATATATPSMTPTVIATAAATPSMTPTAIATPTPSVNHLPELIISEVNDSYYSNTMRWFELYNTSNETLQLSDYRLVALGYEGSKLTAHSFNFSSLSIAPSSYVVARAQSTTETFVGGERLTYIEDGAYRPYWSNGGYLELVKVSDGSVLDFVTIGNVYTPSKPNEWSGSALAEFDHSNGSSYASWARKMPFTDNNNANDWVLHDFATPGGPNDVTCNDDFDLDGIPDCSEKSGSTFAGLDLYALGARENQRDIFIEIDYMDATKNGTQVADIGFIPQRESLQKVVDAFASQNISVHFDVGDLYDNSAGIDGADFDLGGGEQVPYASNMSYNELAGAVNFYDYKRQYFDMARFQIFHYAVFVETIDNGGASGQAELLGNDIMVGWGGRNLNRDSLFSENWAVSITAKTLMHELGHNLGLSHGGNDSDNYKPNYVSIMNYLYSYGLPDENSPDGSHYYYKFHKTGKPCSIDYWSLQNNVQSTSYLTAPLDFSHGVSGDLVESSLNENSGLIRSGAQAIDWDCDGVMESNVMTDINGDGQTTTLKDFDDWGNLNLIFQRTFSGTQEFQFGEIDPDFILMPDNVGDDKGNWVE